MIRRIIDISGRQEGFFSGRAEFRPRSSGRLDYHERGDLRFRSCPFAENALRDAADGPLVDFDAPGLPVGDWPNPAFAAEKTYIYGFENDQIRLSFSDGRLFHDVVPMGRARGSDHLCGADLYQVQYDFEPWPRWRQRYRVTGPRKNYLLETGFIAEEGTRVSD